MAKSILEEDIERGLKKAKEGFAVALARAHDDTKLKEIFADKAAVATAEAMAKEIIKEFSSMLEIATESHDRDDVWMAIEFLKMVVENESRALKFLVGGYRSGFTSGFEALSKNPDKKWCAAGYMATSRVREKDILAALRDFKLE